jgi:HK97 family phage portal protein
MAWPFRRKSEEEHRSSTLAYPSSELLDSLGVSGSWSGERVTEKKALGLAAVFAAVEKISESVGSLPLKVFRVMDDDERVPATTHRSWRMLHDMPNEYTTAHTFWSTVTASLLLRGNAFLFKARDEFDMVDQLWILDPSQITVEWNGKVKRFVQDSPEGRRVWSVDEVLHIMGFSLNGITGCSRIEYCRQSLGTALARSRFEAEFYNQGARIPGVIQYPGRLGEQGVKNLAQGFRDIHTGAGNRHKVPVLEEGATWQSVGMSLEDMQFVEGAQLSRSDIATLFNLPAAYLNASSGDSLTYATTESNQIQFATQAVSPLTNRISKALSSDPAILPWNVMYCEFVLEGLMRADMKTRAEYWKSLKDMGVVDAEYIAARENLPKPPLEKKPEPAALPAPNPNQLQLVKANEN